MIGLLFRAAFKMLLLAAVLYGTFFVPLGKHTLAGHLQRIAGTDEAHDLGAGVADAVEQARGAVSTELGSGPLAAQDKPPPPPVPTPAD